MNADWQTYIVIAIIIVTMATFVARALRKKKGGCSSCGCSAATPQTKSR